MGRPTSLVVARALTINPASVSGPCTVTESSLSLLVSFWAFSCPISEIAARAVIPASAIPANALVRELSTLLHLKRAFRLLILSPYPVMSYALCSTKVPPIPQIHHCWSGHSPVDSMECRAIQDTVQIAFVD